MEPTKIREYARLIREMDLTALEIQADGTVRLERNPSAPAAPAAPAAAPAAAAPAAPAAPAVPGAGAAGQAPMPGTNL